MKKSKFSESRIVRALREHEGGRSVEDIVRESGDALAAFAALEKDWQ